MIALVISIILLLAHSTTIAGVQEHAVHSLYDCQVARGPSDSSVITLELQQSEVSRAGRPLIYVAPPDSNRQGQLVPITNLKPYFKVEGHYIVLDKPIDADQIKLLEITVGCNGFRGGQLRLEIKLIDNANTQAPYFAQRSYTFFIDKKSSKNSLVGTVKVKDRREQVFYQLRGQSASRGLLRVNKTTGQIFTGQRLDYDKMKVLIIAVTSNKRSFQLPKSATATVTVILRDLDKKPTKFSQDVYKIAMETITAKLEIYIQDRHRSPIKTSVVYQYPDSQMTIATIKRCVYLPKMTKSVENTCRQQLELKSRHKSAVFGYIILRACPINSSKCGYTMILVNSRSATLTAQQITLITVACILFMASIILFLCTSTKARRLCASRQRHHTLLPSASSTYEPCTEKIFLNAHAEE